MRFLLRDSLKRLHAYRPGRGIATVLREHGVADAIKMASNENPLGPSPQAVEAARQAAEEMHRYPDASGHDLKHALSEHHDVPVERISLGNGSDDLIHMLGLAFLSTPEHTVVVGDPSFVRYDACAGLADCRLIKVPLDSEMRHDLDQMAARFDEHTRLVFVANPNNPTGTIVSEAALRALIGRLPEGVPLVLDEAYFDFADVADGVGFVKEGLPVVSLRTFSKSHGLAGIRVGYAIAPEEIITAIEKVRQPFNVNSLAQAAAVAALGDHEHVRKTVELTHKGLSKIYEAAEALGLGYTKSYANMVMLDLGQPADPICQAMESRGVIVRSCALFGMPNHLRVTVGTAEQNERFIEALTDTIG